MKALHFLFLLFILGLTHGYGQDSIANSKAGAFTDARDGHVYRYVKIDKQTWMAENLAYLPAVSSCLKGSTKDKVYYVYGYNRKDVNEAKNQENYKTYGVLYNLPAAMNGVARATWDSTGHQGVCPDGWHLPSEEEWNILLNYNKDKLIVEVKTNRNGTSIITDNTNGFIALSGGYRTNYNNTPRYFLGLGYSGNFWTSKLWKSAEAIILVVTHDETTFVSNLGDMGFSVRCIRD